MSLRALRWLLGPKLPVGPAPLHVCVSCRGDFVIPTHRDPCADGSWRVRLRCRACGFERETTVGAHAAELLDEALDTGYHAIAEPADPLESERMREWVETFAAALRADLIDAADF
jgi:hypothetical protein